jgi:hypothetical protein
MTTIAKEMGLIAPLDGPMDRPLLTTVRGGLLGHLSLEGGRWLPAMFGGVDRAANWAELLTPQLTEAFYLGFSDDGRRASMIDQIFGTPSSQRAFEEHLGAGVLGSDGWNFESTGRVQYDDRNKGFLKRFTHVEFAKGFMVQRKLIDDNLTSIAFDSASALGDSAYRKREKGAASIFNNAFTAVGNGPDGMPNAGPDGVALCSASHPRSQSDSTVQSNAGVLPLTETNLGTTRVLHQKITDDRGDLMDLTPDEGLVPPELEDTAIKISRSGQEPGTANNAVNPQAGRFRWSTWHYLTDPTNWFLFDGGRRRRSLLWYDRIPLEFGQEGDFETLQNKFRGYMRYSYGWRDWAWVFGHNAP